MEITQKQYEDYLKSLLYKKSIVKKELEKTPLKDIDITKISKKDKVIIGGLNALDIHLTSSILSLRNFLETTVTIIELDPELKTELDNIQESKLLLVDIVNGKVKLDDRVNDYLNKEN